MDFKQRSFPGNNAILPKPEIFFDDQEKLLIVATPWGASSGAKKIVSTIAEYYLATKNDKDATSPFRRLEYLSSTANNLRIATLVANEYLYREENRSDYRSGVELFVGSIQERELAWVQVGHPNILMQRRGQSLLPISVQLGIANEVQHSGEPLPPLPSSLLGISLEPNLSIQSICPQSGDSIVLLSRAWLPRDIFKSSVKTFDDLSKSLSHDANEPFWLGHWAL
jgi:hypothetical protein